MIFSAVSKCSTVKLCCRSHARIAAAVIKSSGAALCSFSVQGLQKTHTVTALVRAFDSLHNDCHGGECNAPLAQ